MSSTISEISDSIQHVTALLLHHPKMKKLRVDEDVEATRLQSGSTYRPAYDRKLALDCSGKIPGASAVLQYSDVEFSNKAYGLEFSKLVDRKKVPVWGLELTHVVSYHHKNAPNLVYMYVVHEGEKVYLDPDQIAKTFDALQGPVLMTELHRIGLQVQSPEYKRALRQEHRQKVEKQQKIQHAVNLMNDDLTI